jgi:hypothetical protein
VYLLHVLLPVVDDEVKDGRQEGADVLAHDARQVAQLLQQRLAQARLAPAANSYVWQLHIDGYTLTRGERGCPAAAAGSRAGPARTCSNSSYVWQLHITH